MSKLYQNSWFPLNIDVNNALTENCNSFNGLTQTFQPDSSLNIYRFTTTHLHEPTNIPLTNLFNSEWLTYMSNIGLEVAGTMIFYRTSECVIDTAHIDLPYVATKNISIALNWVLGGEGSYMTWYNRPDTDPIFDGFTTATTRYAAWPQNELTEIDRCYISNSPILVRTDIPHNVIMGTAPRWAISVRLKYKPESWNIIVDHMKPFINDYREQ